MAVVARCALPMIYREESIDRNWPVITGVSSKSTEDVPCPSQAMARTAYAFRLQSLEYRYCINTRFRLLTCTQYAKHAIRRQTASPVPEAYRFGTATF
jgi:hypothetical protein